MEQWPPLLAERPAVEEHPNPLIDGSKGRSFAAVLRDEHTAHRDAVIVERITVLKAVEDEEDDLILRVKMLVTPKWKLLHYGSAPYGELYDVENDPQDEHNLWDDPSCADVKRALCDRLLAELIDSELGDPVAILERRGLGGALRDARQMERQPEARAQLRERIRSMD